MVATALFLNPYSRTSFEPDKAAMARTYVLLMLGCWAALRVYTRRASVGVPRAAAIGVSIFLAWTASVALSTASSIAPDLSWSGSYARGQGALLDIAYLALFATLAARLRHVAQWRRLRLALATCSVPICVLALAQRAGVVIPTGNEPLQVNATFGNPTFLAAFLLLPLFVTADFIVEASHADRSEGRAGVAGLIRSPRLQRAAVPAAVIVLQLAALLTSQGSAALIGLLFGVTVLVAGALAMRRADPASARPAIGRWRRRRSVLAVVVVVAGFAWLSVTVDRATGDDSVIDVATVLNPERDANRVRLLIWNTVPRAMTDPSVADVRRTAWRWLVGFGPETTWLALEHSYPAGLERVESWESLPDRAHNQVLEILLTRGLLGVGCYLLTVAALLSIGLRAAGLLIEPGSTRRFIGALVTGATLGAIAALAASSSWAVGAVGVVPGMIIGAVAYLLLRSEGNTDTLPHQPVRSRRLALLLTAAVVAHLVETQFGIAVTATQTCFWVLAGALVAVRYGTWVGDSTARDSGSSEVDGLLTGAMLATLAYGLWAPGPGPWMTVAVVLQATWLCGAALSSVGRTSTVHRGGHWVRFLVASALAATPAIVFHRLQLATAAALRGRGADVAASSTIGGLFDGYQAWMLATAVGMGVMLSRSRARASVGATTDLKHGTWPRHVGRSRARTAAAVALIAALGILLPRTPHIIAVRADILAAQADSTRRAERFATSAQLYQEALASRPDEIAYRVGLATVQSDWAALAPEATRDKRFGRAAAQLRQALRSEQAGGTEHANLARLYIQWGEAEADPVRRAMRLERADRHYRNALGRRPQSARYFAEWGRLSVLQGRLDPARWRFGRSLTLDPTQGQTYLWVRPLLGTDLMDDPAALAELGADAGTIAPEQVHAALVEHFIEAGLFELALEAAFRLTATIPAQPLGHWTVAGLYSRLGEPEPALPYARRALTLAHGRERRQVARLIRNLEAASERRAQ